MNHLYRLRVDKINDEGGMEHDIYLMSLYAVGLSTVTGKTTNVMIGQLKSFLQMLC